MFKPAAVLLASVFALALSASAAFAHAVLVKSSPGAGEALAQDDLELHLTFSEALEPSFSIFKIEAVDGADAKVSVSFDDDRREVVLRLDEKLRAGSYRVRWKVVTKDTHRMEGALPFLVR